MTIKCECNLKGELGFNMESWYDKKFELPFVNHNPNECKCRNELKQYKRGSKILWLCSCCCLSGDKIIKPKVDKRKGDD